ncbi:uncharacterized protein LAESUDRAFT_717714 [Laetiporus sulphureus 93-53]|uniref:Uncharacterized protein n=1 Tax=Laetiporus sulphureus 93-53 TaxID=1314785 RepID=A0A165BI15_9APHY|nr:uncharacterized protein LAESUDRAFT_717714 [Laetiporus sulphureus 93-53]KZT01099.1 hypothetical protein LAESUDRAFT_717714 [Laetiporus sulphureus 93-53]
MYVPQYSSLVKHASQAADTVSTGSTGSTIKASTGPSTRKQFSQETAGEAVVYGAQIRNSVTWGMVHIPYSYSSTLTLSHVPQAPSVMREIQDMSQRKWVIETEPSRGSVKRIRLDSADTQHHIPVSVEDLLDRFTRAMRVSKPIPPDVSNGHGTMFKKSCPLCREVLIKVYENAKDWNAIREITFHCLPSSDMDLKTLGCYMGAPSGCQVIDLKNFKPFHEYCEGILEHDDLKDLMSDGFLQPVRDKLSDVNRLQ